jgi:hypothetical protein
MMKLEDIAGELLQPHVAIEKRAMTNLHVLNEAFCYDRPSSFSRGLRIDIGDVAILLISGTASIDEEGAVPAHLSQHYGAARERGCDVA